MSLEVCVDSIGSACTAKQYGADRLEVCSALACGGLTPSLGLVQQVAALWIPFRIMLRPRAGNFCYSQLELQTIILEIQNFINLKETAFLEGFVIGCLDEEGRIDMATAQTIIDSTPPHFSFTWHRAIDCCTQPLSAAAKLIAANPRIDCILTSGGADEAIEGLETILTMMEAVKDTPVVIMPGSGVNDGTAAAIRAGITGAGHVLSWLHASCSRRITSGHKLKNDEFAATDAASLCDLRGRL